MTSVTEPGITTPTQVGAPESPQEVASARAWYALGALIVAMLFGFIDRQILVLLAEPIKHDLSLSDLQIGETHGLGPAIFTAVAMFPLAWLADRTERRTVLCICVLFWSIATAASGLAINFVTLQACAIAIVVGEAALTPIVYSLIPDLFPPKSRPRANIIAYAATALGTGLGLTFGGMLISVVADLRLWLPAGLQALETWRLAFFLVALPGPLVAIAVFLIGATRREVSAQDLPPAVGMGAYVKEHGWLALGVFGTMAFFAFALTGVGNWLPIALIRTFKADAASVGVNFGLTFMGGAVVGLVIAAIMTPYWRRTVGPAFVLRAIAFASAGAAVPALLLGFATSIWQAYALFFCFTAIFVTGTALMPGMMQDIAPPALRTRVIAVGTVVFMVMGGASPPLVGFISDRVSGSPRGLMWAIVATAVTGFLLCSALARFIEGSYRRTVEGIATTLSRAADSAPGAGGRQDPRAGEVVPVPGELR